MTHPFKQLLDSMRGARTRQYWLHALLFVCVYAGSLYYLQRSASTGQKMPVFDSVGLSTAVVQQLRGKFESIVSHVDGRQQPGSSAAQLVTEQDAAAKSVELDETQKLRAAPEQINTWISRASSAEAPEERAEAILELSRAASDRDILQAMSQVMSLDTSTRNRGLAVGALVTVANNGGSESALALDMLQRASSDTDPRIAMRARAAYRKLTGQKDESETQLAESE